MRRHRLEVATLVVLAVVGTLAFVALGGAIGAGRPLVAGDAKAAELAEALRTPSAERVVAWLSDLGSIPVTALITALTAVAAVRRGRAAAAAAVVAGLAVTWVVVHVAKTAEARPRPADPFTETFGLSYPSGHSAYAVALVACVVVLTPTGRRRALAAVLLLALFVGASRIYLRVHYLSDVLGGFAVGATAFALCGLAALAVGRFRHTGART